MTPEDWRRVQELMDRALDLPLGEREAFLATLDEPAMRREVEALIAAVETSDGRLDTPPPGGGVLEKMALDPPEGLPRVGAYQLLDTLGEGGMGTVYLAERHDGIHGQKVALKLMRRGFFHPSVEQRFRGEREILAHLDHPNIARLLDGGSTEDGRPYLVMEHVEGLRLDTYCDEHRLDIRSRLELFAKVCDAVQYAHQNLVVHRDLKPGNILVTADGEPKLLDFGIAKLLEPEFLPMTMLVTRSGERPLTPAYASPEQLEGSLITTASDVFSLGVMLFELLTGRRPFESGGGSLDEIARLLKDTAPPRPSTVIPRPLPDRPGAVGAPEGTLTVEASPRPVEESPEGVDLPPTEMKPIPGPVDPARPISGDTDSPDTVSPDAVSPDTVSPDAVSPGPAARALLSPQDVAARRRSDPGRLSRTLSGDLDSIVLRALSHKPEGRYPSAEQLRQDIGRYLEGLPVVARDATFVYRAAKFVRRHRWPVAAATLVLLVSLAFLSSLLVQRQQTREQSRRVSFTAEFLSQIFTDADPIFAEGTVLAARELLDQQTLTLSEDLSDQTAVRANLLATLAQAYLNLGEMERAEQAAEQSLELQQRLHPGGGHRDLASAQLLVCRIASHRQDWASAESQCEGVLALWNQLVEGPSLEKAVALEALARMDAGQGRADDAREHFEAAVRMARVLDRPADLGRILNNFGLFMAADEPRQGVRLLEESAARLREAHGDQHPRVATALANLGVLYGELGEIERAIHTLSEAEVIQRAYYGENHPRLLETLAALEKWSKNVEN